MSNLICRLGLGLKLHKKYADQFINSLRPIDAYISKQTTIDSDKGLSPGRRQAIIWTNVGMFSTGPLGTNISEILIDIYRFWFKKMYLKT